MQAGGTIKRNQDFRRLYRRGRRAAGAEMVVYCGRNRLGRNRVGITVSVRVGNAVVRNRIRRRLREVCRLHAHCLTSGWDLVLVGRGQARDASWADLNAAFLRLCRTLGLLRPDL